MAEAAKRKSRTRQGHRLVVSNAIAKAQSILPPPGTEASADIKPKLESLKNTLIKERSEITKLNDDILENVKDDDQIKKEILESAEVDEEIEDAICHITDALTERAVTAVSTTSSSMRGDSGYRSEHVQLPTLPLTIFDGDPTQWTSFWDSFR